MPRRTTKKRSARYDNEEDEDHNEEEQKVKEEKGVEDDSHHHRHHHHHHHRRKKIALMSESDQTDAERRQLRREQRALMRNITTTSLGDDMEDPNKNAFAEVRDKNNVLWNDVRYTREAVLDAENVDLISERAARQIDRLVQVARYDAGRLSQKLRSKCSTREIGSSSSHFDWVTLGVESGACFNTVPSRCTFLCGPIDTTYVPKERKKTQRRRTEEDDAEAEKVEEMKDKDSDKEGSADKLSAVEQHIKVISKTLNKRGREEMHSRVKEISERNDLDGEARNKMQKRAKRHGSDIDAVKYLFNPKSFTQTVENIFHFSFLVRKGSAGIFVRSKEESEKYGGAKAGPVVRAVGQSSEKPPPRQAIVSLNMKDWRDMCNAFEVTKGDIPHRTGSKHERPHTASP